jgi:subfamily B ATP-binding cassette protein MsbA
MFIGSLVLMLILNWRLTILILLIAPFVAISAVFFGRKMRRLSTDVQDNVADSSATAEEALSNIRIVKAFNRETFEVKRYTSQVEKIFLTTMRMAKYRAAFGPLIMFLAFSSLAAILWFGGREVLAGRLTGGALIAFLVYGINIAASIGSFSSLYTQLQEAAGASHRIFELIDEKPDIINKPNAKHLLPITQNIRFVNVSFSYPSSQDVLHNINLVINAGEVLALVGPSGAGKTTLFNLIPRFYDPTNGSILIDGNDLRDVTIESLRDQIGLVPQETQLFSGSIYENIRYGKLDATKEDVYQAAIAANADDFIQKLPKSYETLVGERGVKVSGGQRQRISIARAILRNPQILLLDEATSNLDTESERLVQDALDHLLKDRTTIIIAHRLSTVHKANRIAVLNNGFLVELGDHPQLMEKNGLYAKLYRLQFEERHKTVQSEIFIR